MQPLFSILLIAAAVVWGERTLASPRPSVQPGPPFARVAFTTLPSSYPRVPEHDFPCCVSLGKAFESEIIVLGRKSGPAWSQVPVKNGLRICRTGLSGFTVRGYPMFDADSLETCVRMVSLDRLRLYHPILGSDGLWPSHSQGAAAAQGQ